MKRGFQIIYELGLASCSKQPLSSAVGMTRGVPNPGVPMAPVPQASSILASLGQAAFLWDLTTDTIVWSDNAVAVFTDIPSEALASGSGFARLIEPSRSIRTEAIAQSAPARGGEGVAYRIEYGIRAAASAPVIWIEETGCWFAGPDGKPGSAQGIVRVNNERHARDEQLMRLSRHDPLTGELNRTHLVAALAETIEEAMRFRSGSAFMLIGIDHLSRVNDAFVADPGGSDGILVARQDDYGHFHRTRRGACADPQLESLIKECP